MASSIVSDFRCGSIAIVGRPNVGKSTLLNLLVGEKASITSRKPHTTRHQITAVCTTALAQYVFVDTPGFGKSSSSKGHQPLLHGLRAFLQTVDVVLYVVEAMRFGPADQQVLNALPPDQPILLIINKIDRLASPNQLLPFIESMAQRFAFAEIVPFSAERSVKPQALLEVLQPHLPVACALYDSSTVSPHPQSFMIEEIVREKIYRFTGQELPYQVEVRLEKAVKKEQCMELLVEILVERPGQKAILIGHQGQKLKIIGSAARVDLEKQLGCPIFLQTWVRAKKKHDVHS